MSKYNLTKESYEKLLDDCYKKSSHQSDDDWSEIAAKHNLPWNSDSLRKASTSILGGSFVKQFYEEKYARSSTPLDEDEYFKKLRAEKDEIYKLKRQFYDQRREYNKLLISDGRADHLTSELIECAKRLNKEKPLNLTDYISEYYTEDNRRVAVLFWADWHYGMTTDNIWNTFNVEICKHRIAETVAKTIEYLKQFKITELTIVALGDLAHGALHSTCRIASEEETCDQLMHVSELIAQAIGELSEHVNSIEFYSCYGNHLRTIQDKKDSIHSDNMEKIIPWWLRQRLQNNSKVRVIDSEFKEMVKINILGYNMVCLHGDLDNIKNIGVTVNTLFSKLYGETIDYVVSADKHHLEEFEQFDIESVIVRCLCGTDDYAHGKRLYSSPGQTLMIFNAEEGRECTRNIKFKNK